MVNHIRYTVNKECPLKELSNGVKILGIIGYPLKHSLSFYFQNKALKALNLKYIYVPFEIKPEKLKDAFYGFRVLQIKGLNVTVPFKERCIKYLDKIKGIAKEINSVNTIVRKGKKLIGYNTDVYGFITPLKKRNISLKNKKVALFGAGGAARAVLFALKSEQVKEILIFNRSEKRRKKLKEEFSKFIINIRSFPLQEGEKRIIDVDLIVNATSVGMLPDVNKSIIKKFPSKSFYAYDLIYNPLKTKFLSLAEKAGGKIITGEKMLLYQGELSFKIFTGVNPPLKVMEREIKKRFKGEDF
jgi:shikimate dehydrogenase